MSDTGTTSYLVERYLADPTADGLARVVAKDRDGAARMIAKGIAVRWVQSTLIPLDESCLCLFESPSEDAVREANDRMDNRYERISEALTTDANLLGEGS